MAGWRLNTVPLAMEASILTNRLPFYFSGNETHFEEEPMGVKAGVKIRDLTKVCALLIILMHL